MEQVIPELVRSLAVQGTGWIVAILEAVIIIFLFRMVTKGWEARMEESKAVAVALRDTADTVADLAKLLNEVRATQSTQSALTAQLSNDYNRNNSDWRDRISKLENNIQSVRDDQVRRFSSSPIQSNEPGRG